MPTIVLRVDPRPLENPDLDIRYTLPDLLAEKSGGTLMDDGYDYVGDRPYLLIFLKTAQAETGTACVLDLIETGHVLGNDLRPAVVVAVDQGQGYEVVYPAGFRGAFPV